MIFTNILNKMKGFAPWVLNGLCMYAISCGSNTNTSNLPDASLKNRLSESVTRAGSTAGFQIGIQMWSFRMFSFSDALNKVDSAGVKYIEAFFGQELGGDMKGSFDPEMSAGTRTKLKQLLRSKGIQIMAIGVISPGDSADWKKAFDLAKEFGLRYITAEPHKKHWDMIDKMSSEYGIKIAIHDHPKPSPYSAPDSVIEAMRNHLNIGACADVGHWARNGLDPVACIKKLDGRIYGVHLKDVVKFDDTNAADTVIGKGVIDFPAIFAELKRQSFSGMMSIEHESNSNHKLPDIVETVTYYKDQVARLQ